MKQYVFLSIALCLSVAAQAPPRVLVIGDSISIGYTPHLAAALGCPVEHSPGNAQWSAYTLEHLDQWVSGHYDAIVYNNGLHDIAHPEGQIRATLHEYTANVDAIIATLCIHTDCLIVPTITCVPADYPQDYRSNEDARLYGSALAAVARRHGATVVNLYGPTASHPQWFPPADVHPYLGYPALGNIIADVVRTRIDGVEMPAVGPLALFALCLVLCSLFRH